MLENSRRWWQPDMVCVSITVNTASHLFQLSHRVLAELEVHPFINPGFHHQIMEHPDITMCQNIHRACEPNLLLVLWLCTRGDSDSKRQWRRKSVLMESSNETNLPDSRRSSRCLFSPRVTSPVFLINCSVVDVVIAIAVSSMRCSGPDCDLCICLQCNPKRLMIASASMEKDPTIRIWVDESDSL